MLLMSKNTILAQIDFSKYKFDIIQPNLMPFALRGNNVDLFTFRDWLSNRVLNISRSNAKKIISALKLNQNNRIEMCLACKGLSLTDCYWLKYEKDKVTWEDVNLYGNSLTNAVAKIALTGEYVSIQGKIRTPELTNGGSYAKCWRRGKDGIYLYKAGSLQGNGMEHRVEVLVSNLLDTLNVEHVKYNLTTSSLKEVSRCKNMTDTERSICDMEYYEGYCNRNNINIVKWLMLQEEYYKMLIVDYLIFNSDRHSGNWGVYFSSDTGQLIGLHPLFDHNLSFDLNGDPMSKVINGKSLEQCAKWAKQYINLDITKFHKMAKSKYTKQELNKIFKRNDEYIEFINRINNFMSW